MQSSNASPTPYPGAGRGGARSAAPRQRHTFWWYLKWFFNIISAIVFCALVITICLLKSLYDQIPQVVPDIRSIYNHSKAEPTRIYAADGSLLAELKGDQRQWVDIGDLEQSHDSGGQQVEQPGNLINATLSIEDSRFYTHVGVDPKRILGAAWANYRSGESTRQGGSTITEQLAKSILNSRKKTLARRVETLLLSLQLEKKLSKDEILELYLNTIYYGNRAYGCEAAARTYFNKHAGQLTVSEAAFLAGLPNSPTRFNPFENFELAQRRQHIVLHEMLVNQKITEADYQSALNDDSISEQIEHSKARAANERTILPRYRAPYFVAYVKQYLEKEYQWTDDYLNQGLKIYTTLDPQIQNIAEQHLREGVADHDQGDNLQGAMVCIDPWTGHILAMVGGTDYYAHHNGQWNRAVQSKRQPGSTFKPYIYATAMEMGETPESRVVDEPFVLYPDTNSEHEVNNYDFIHRGNISYKEAIGISDNVAATKVLLKVGINNVIQKAHLMGIQSALPAVPSLALGTCGLSVLEHTSAFGVFATHGVRAESTPVERVETYSGETLLDHPHPVRGARVLSEDAADKMWEMLRYVVTNGTGRAAELPDAEAIGKTGTTSDNHDVWFMGATKDLVCGVWMGYDQPKELEGGAGGKWCAPVWRGFMEGALSIWNNRHPVQKIVEDAHLTEQRKLMASQYKKYVKVRVCDESGLLANSSCPKTHWQTFSVADAPTQHCDIHTDNDPSDQTSDITPVGSDPQSGDPTLGITTSSDVNDEDANEHPRHRSRRPRRTTTEQSNPDGDQPVGRDQGPPADDAGSPGPKPAPDAAQDRAPADSGGGDSSPGETSHDEGLARHSGDGDNNH